MGSMQHRLTLAMASGLVAARGALKALAAQPAAVTAADAVQGQGAFLQVLQVRLQFQQRLLSSFPSRVSTTRCEFERRGCMGRKLEKDG